MASNLVVPPNLAARLKPVKPRKYVNTPAESSRVPPPRGCLDPERYAHRDSLDQPIASISHVRLPFPSSPLPPSEGGRSVIDEESGDDADERVSVDDAHSNEPECPSSGDIDSARSKGNLVSQSVGDGHGKVHNPTGIPGRRIQSAPVPVTSSTPQPSRRVDYTLLHAHYLDQGKQPVQDSRRLEPLGLRAHPVRDVCPGLASPQEPPVSTAVHLGPLSGVPRKMGPLLNGGDHSVDQVVFDRATLNPRTGVLPTVADSSREERGCRRRRRSRSYSSSSSSSRSRSRGCRRVSRKACKLIPLDPRKGLAVAPSESMSFIPVAVIHEMQEGIPNDISIAWFSPSFANEPISGNARSQRKNLNCISSHRINVGDFYAIARHLPLAIRKFYVIPGHKEDSDLVGAIADMFQRLFDLVTGRPDFHQLFSSYHNVRIDLFDRVIWDMIREQERSRLSRFP
ncbi:hypothetical protein E1B28_013392 [Marasmius oreades]|uniref:Uncharacterized protein n=1 Tax=Marasmius oreades TaxID=181124 RepID=A0A9P7UMY8_9AGAR|nr:uncharacterized protein E1B28_013392 [Marasmius oreades]KAG7087425.1 hypothetical protein E1B28_013392 [Marasmius oreades]